MRLLPAEHKARYTEAVSFWEDTHILETVDKLAAARGSDRSAIYREAIRHHLARMGLLDKENLKILGIRLEGALKE